MAGLTQRESLGVLEVLSGVSGAVAKRFGGTLDFRALAVAAGTDTLPEESLPFARIAASVLRGLGGIYGDLATYLAGEPAGHPPAAATTTSEAAHSPELPDTDGSAMSTDQQIPAVLAARAAQRDFVEGLAASWERLAASCEGLITSAGAVAAAAASITAPDSVHAAIFADMTGYLAEGNDWRRRAGSLSAAMTQATASVAALRQRIHRSTINIAVMGTTGAGKSTLLRRLTGLSEDVIPSNHYTSTTATPVRISHQPRSGAGHAVLNLHTWETFRADVLVPLHERAQIPGSPPGTVDEFRRFSAYGEARGSVSAGHAGAERYRRRLRLAQDSLPSYASLLRGGTMQISLEDLRPFTAYPVEDDSRGRPYHAVRSIDIFCEYPMVGAIPLVLIDLPGSGEAGLDIHQRYLTELRYEADLLLVVKRVERTLATDADWDVLQLADDASAGVRRSDFLHYVINRDADVPSEYFDSALARTTADAMRLGIDVRVCDIERSAPDEVTEAILAPELSLLAERLAAMDRDAATFVLAEISGTVTQARNLVGELAQRIGSWQASLPDPAERLRGRIRELRLRIASDLDRVCAEYDQLSAAGQPIGELDDEIEKGRRHGTGMACRRPRYRIGTAVAGQLRCRHRRSRNRARTRSPVLRRGPGHSLRVRRNRRRLCPLSGPAVGYRGWRAEGPAHRHARPRGYRQPLRAGRVRLSGAEARDEEPGHSDRKAPQPAGELRQHLLPSGLAGPPFADLG